MAQTLPISAVKARLPELVTGVEEREEEIIVTRKGKPAAPPYVKGSVKHALRALKEERMSS
jgi:hypothetical protein